MAYTTIDDPSAYFQTTLYTGSGGSTQSVVNGGNSDLQPDLVWVKNRTDARWHRLVDSSRGASKNLYSNETDAEGTEASVTAFNSDGFSLGTDTGSDGWNEDGDAHVAWQWKANGGTTASNTDGSITSTVQANTTAGFNIVQYVGNGSSGATFGHGLGVAPEVVILKNRDTARSWFVGHLSLGFNFITHLNQTTASDEDSVYWNNTAPSSTVVTLGNNEGGNENTNNFVAYCFKEKQGYSKFGSYTGNGNADGTFVYTGFKPAWVMFKATTGTENWGIFDNKRNTQTGNPRDIYLMPSASNADSSESDSVDFLSNGFKWRIDSGFRNGNGVNFIYMAFAESPFVSSKGAPTTAR
jgi:hypothetical protein